MPSPLRGHRLFHRLHRGRRRLEGEKQPIQVFAMLGLFALYRICDTQADGRLACAREGGTATDAMVYDADRNEVERG
jgi:hypothetical protein